MDKKEYKKYKQRIAQTEAKIDNKAPPFHVAYYYDKHNMRSDLTRIREIDRENMTLLRRINIIVRFGGNIDCWLPKIIYRPKFYEQQKAENKKIKTQNKNILQKIQNATIKVIGLQLIPDHCMVKDLSLLKEMNPSIRTKCFFEIEIKGDQKLGCIQFELYNDIVPQTCKNFAELCRGFNGLSYKNTPFHRIVSGYWCQGGDVTKFNGSGGISIYGDFFENENYNLHHAGPGILSMCNENENKSNSKFNLTFKRLETVNEKNVVFGKVIAGLSNIYKIEEFGTKTGKPFKTIIVSNCGII
ncbi:E3 SUMO-protein ligase RanBP2 [Apis cerana cerana]|uniref:Peptidyl-prolyl cis-trans isomerase n=2 Tax=Apis cerana TaxID=7461 RepID=A0A2A3EAA9_APICC|nr:E3 SUMO-protein ligase RanBP2 [Apis cerana cerana]